MKPIYSLLLYGVLGGFLLGVYYQILRPYAFLGDQNLLVLLIGVLLIAYAIYKASKIATNPAVIGGKP